MPADLAERVIAIITATQHFPPGKVTPDSTFAELGIDSLDGINILFALENEFSINIPDDAAKEIRSVQDAIRGVAQLLDGSGAAA